MGTPDRAVLKIITFFVAPEKLDDFIQFEVSEYERFAGMATGLLSIRLTKCVFRAPYSPSPHSMAVSLAVFRSRADHDAWMNDPRFIEHRKKVEIYIESAEIGFFEVEHSSIGFDEIAWPNSAGLLARSAA
jgi:heme-degrading monooxygenase HmoA